MKTRQVVTSVCVLALAGAASGLAVALLPTEERTLPVPVIETGGPAQALCPGGFERTLGQGLDVGQVDEGVTASSWFLTASDATEFLPWPSGDSPVDGPFEKRAVTAGAVVGALHSEQASTEAEQFAGANIYSARAGDTRGLAIGPCVSSAVDFWFVGSASGVGISNQLLLFNPGQTSVGVQLTAYGSRGPLSLGTMSSVAVAADSMERVDLDGLIPSDSRIALHVSTESGAIAALMQSNEIDGAKPRGVSIMSGSSKGRELLIPAITVPQDTAATPSVRIVNTETLKAKVSVELIGPDGRLELPGGSDVAVAPGAVLDLSLAGVKAGDYALRVTSEQVIAAGALLLTADSAAGARDVTWASAREPLTSGAVAVGETTTSAIVTSLSDEQASAQIIPVSKEGIELSPLPVDLAGPGTVTVELPEGAVGFLFSSSQPVLAGALSRIAVDGGDGIEWTPVFTPAVDDALGRIAATN
ncbi:MAG: DUF5719 family protein [Ancrocorticia sp.]